MKDIEIWKDIPGYEGFYEVSTFGNVRSKDRVTLNDRKIPRNTQWYRFFPGKIITPELTHGGYLRIKLTKLGNRKKFFVHRLVAMAFIENPLNLPFINHKDEVKTNNNVHNLEWCDHDYNIHYGTLQIRKTNAHKKEVIQYDEFGGFVKEWKSATDAANELDFNQSKISQACRNKNKYKNFIWRFKYEEN